MNDWNKTDTLLLLLLLTAFVVASTPWRGMIQIHKHCSVDNCTCVHDGGKND